MTKYFIDGKLVATTNTQNPHGALREKLTNAQLDGRKVEIVRE